MLDRSTSSTVLLTLFLAIIGSVIAEELFDALDLNHDGSLGKDEFFDNADINHDGSLDKDEFQQFLQKFQSFLSAKPLIPPAAVSLIQLPTILTLEGFWKAFTSSFAMILATEVGDKTFFIAAILSMKHSRSAVFSGAIGALIVMTILSTAMGLVLPTFIPRKYTHWLGGTLFMYFGIKLLYESRGMDAAKTSEELEEVEEELGGSSNKKEDVEEGRVTRKQSSTGTTALSWYQVTLQAFTLTFIAEWGDRSQIATIALAAAKNAIGVTIGGTLGHSLCTGVAVLGGRMIASRISEKSVSQVGGVIFCICGIHSLFFET